MDAGKWSLGEGNVGGCQGPLVDLGQEGRDARAHVGVVFLARNEGEDGDEAVKLVGACQRPYTGTLMEHQDFHDEGVKRLGIDLKQLVARIFFEDMQHGLARMAVRVEAGALEHLGHLVADIGDLPRRACIGA